MGNRFKVFFPKPHQRGSIDLGLATYPVVFVGVNGLARMNILPAFGSSVAMIPIYGLDAPVFGLSGEMLTSLQHENL